MNRWRLTPHHLEPKKAFEHFQDLNRIAIGWNDIGDLSVFPTPPSPREINGRLTREVIAVEKDCGRSLRNLYVGMSIGDLVLVRTSDLECVMEVAGPYMFVNDEEAICGYRHQRAACVTNISTRENWGKPMRGENPRGTLVKISSGGDDVHLYEGTEYRLCGTAFERNPLARIACIQAHGYKCVACGFDFFENYGEIGKGYIQVHHHVPLSVIRQNYKVDPTKDLVPLCANCHAMVHRGNATLSIPELVEVIRRRKHEN